GGELAKDADGRGGRVVRQLGYGAERVEEKVWLELRLEIVEPRTSERVLEKLRLLPPLLERAAHERHLAGRDDDQVRHDVEVEIEQQQSDDRQRGRCVGKGADRPRCECR